VAESHNNIGISHDALGDHKKALEYKQKSLAIRLKLYGENNSTVAEIYNEIG
jgi:hypothetical protein